MNSVLNLRESLSSLTKTEAKVARYILDNLETVINESAQTVAKKSDTSASAVVRLSKTLGYAGFPELKLQIAKDATDPLETDFAEMIQKGDTFRTLMHKAEHANKTTFSKVYRLIDPDNMEAIIEALSDKEVIYIVGLGGSSIASLDLFHKLTRVNRKCVYNQDFHMFLTSLAHITENDAVIVFSYSGQTKEALLANAYATNKKALSISVTSSSKSQLAKKSDYSILIPQEEKELRLGAISSRFAFLAVSDLLYFGLAQRELDEVTDKLLTTRTLLSKLSR